MLRSLSWRDLKFNKHVPYVFYSECGVPQTHWAPVGMPLIPKQITNAVFYLFRNRDDALAGRDPGGTGFVVRYDSDRASLGSQHSQFYAVTNYHVAVSGHWPTIRLNKKGGNVDIIELDSAEWHWIPGKYDIAATPIHLDDAVHDIAAVGTHMFVVDPDRSRQYRSEYIGIGDDVFMIGLFADHYGASINIPSARFGNISMLPNEKAKIKQTSTGYDGVSYVVDMHSRAGFSGSPVFVYRTFGADLSYSGSGEEFDDLQIEVPLDTGADYRDSSFARPLRGRLKTRSLFKLLGIHWAQFPERWELGLRQAKGDEAAKLNTIPESGYVEGFSGMTCVIPAWQILEVLDMPELKAPRDMLFAKNYGPKLESSPLSTDANPTHREDFTRLVGEAARKREPED